MVQVIDIQPTQRGPRTSYLVGQALGNAAQQAGSMYLQGKMQDMFDMQRSERSAEGLSKLVAPEFKSKVYESFRRIPVEYHREGLAMAVDMIGSGEMSSGGGKEPLITEAGVRRSDLRMPSSPSKTATKQQMQPQPSQEAYAPPPQAPMRSFDQGMPQSPAAVAANIAAMQRMGQGMPIQAGYPQAQGAAPFQPLQQQYQPAIGQQGLPPQALPQQGVAQPRVPTMAGGQVPPRSPPIPSPEAAGMAAPTMTTPGMAAAQPEEEDEEGEEGRTPLHELSNAEFNELLNRIPSAKKRKELVDRRKSERASARAEEDIALKQSKEKRAERQEFREAEKENQRRIDSYYKPRIEKNRDLSDAATKTLPKYRTALVTNENMRTAPATWDSLVSQMEPPWNQFISKNAQILGAQTPEFIVDFRDKMGGVLTNAKIQLIQSKIVGLGKNKSVNRLICFMSYYDKKLDELKGVAQEEILQENNWQIPPDFSSKLQEKLLPYRRQIQSDIDKMLNEKLPRSQLAQEAYGKFEDKPDAKTFIGETITDTDTNIDYYSDGKNWIEVK
jgi:hypothetical protein